MRWSLHNASILFGKKWCLLVPWQPWVSMAVCCWKETPKSYYALENEWIFVLAWCQTNCHIKGHKEFPPRTDWLVILQLVAKVGCVFLHSVFELYPIISRLVEALIRGTAGVHKRKAHNCVVFSMAILQGNVLLVSTWLSHSHGRKGCGCSMLCLMTVIGTKSLTVLLRSHSVSAQHFLTKEALAAS